MDLTLNPLAIALQFIPFLVVLGALYAILFKPMLAYLDARWEAIEGERQKAAALEERVSASAADYERRLNAAQAEVAELRAKRRSEALAEHARIVAEARHSAEQKVGAALASLAEEKASARSTMESTSRDLAARIAHQVLGRTVAAE